jgi:hypothetical protein
MNLAAPIHLLALLVNVVPFTSGFYGRPSQSSRKLPWNVQLLASGSSQFVGIKARQNAQFAHVNGIHIGPNLVIELTGASQPLAVPVSLSSRCRSA